MILITKKMILIIKKKASVPLKKGVLMLVF